MKPEVYMPPDEREQVKETLGADMVHLRSAIQKAFDRANRSANQLQPMKSLDDATHQQAAVIKDLRQRYADLLYAWKRGVIHHEDSRWEILQRKIIKMLGIDLFRALKVSAKAMTTVRLKNEGLAQVGYDMQAVEEVEEENE